MHLRPAALLTAIVVAVMVLLPSAASATATPSPSPSVTGEATDAPPAGQLNTAPTEGSYIAVTLVDSSKVTADLPQGTPVPGVGLQVEGADGTAVGQGVTDAEGRTFITIPGNGKYVVKIDRSTLPDGIEIDRSQTTVDVKLAGASFVIFPIGVAEVEQVSLGTKLAQSIAQGVKLGLVIALAALGLSMVFGTTGLTNFSHGELMTFGAFATFVFNTALDMPVIWAGLLSVVAGGVFGWLNERLLWRPLRRIGVSLIAMMIVSIGLSLALRSTFQFLFGSGPRPYTQYVSQRQKDLGLISLTPKDMWVMGICVVTIALVCLLLATTRIGKATRAVSDNPALAASSGLRVDGVISNVWIVGTALTALSGTLMAVLNQASFNIGFNLLLLIFAGVTLGGLGTIWGALLGSLVIGVTVQVGPIFGVPESIKYAGALAILIIVLLVRPQGILGRRDRIG